MNEWRRHEGVNWKARNLWSAAVEWSSNGLQEWKPNESMLPQLNWRRLLRLLRQAVGGCQWQRHGMAAARIVKAASGHLVFTPELAHCARCHKHQRHSWQGSSPCVKWQPRLRIGASARLLDMTSYRCWIRQIKGS